MVPLVPLRNATRDHDGLWNPVHEQDFGRICNSQGFDTIAVHHMGSIPYLKEENGIVERANKEVNRYTRNILLDKECVANWPQMLCMTEKLLNSSVKQPLGASSNPRLFGNSTIQEPDMMKETSDTGKISVWDYIDTFMARQGKLLDAARRSQEATNNNNLRKRYANYQQLPQLRCAAAQARSSNIQRM